MKFKHLKSSTWSFNQQFTVNETAGTAADPASCQSWGRKALQSSRSLLCTFHSPSLWDGLCPMGGHSFLPSFLWDRAGDLAGWPQLNVLPGAEPSQLWEHLLSSSEATQPWVAHSKSSKFSWSCPQMISSLCSKESPFFLSTAWWLLELCSGWGQSRHFPAFLVGVQTAFMLNMILGSRFGEFWGFSSYA